MLPEIAWRIIGAMSVPPRARIPGGMWFFTVVVHNRQHNDILVRHVDLLREAIRSTRRRYPFAIHAWVVLPDHLHCILELPTGDDDYPQRWRLIKTSFSRSLPQRKTTTASPSSGHPHQIWQKRYWEHAIRDERDYWMHMDYVHNNPVRHGLVTRARDWPWSTFHHLVSQGVYAPDWGGDTADDGRWGE